MKASEDKINRDWPSYLNDLGVSDPRPMANFMRGAPRCKNCNDVFGNNNFGAEHICVIDGKYIKCNYEPKS